MPNKKWTPAQRKKFMATMKQRKENPKDIIHDIEVLDREVHRPEPQRENITMMVLAILNKIL